MLTVTNVNKSFENLDVLKNVSLNVNKGDVIAILGPSGSGKTTLLRCINFLEKADSGMMKFDEDTYDLHSIKKTDIAKIRKKTGFVFQNYNLFANKTALENVMEGLVIARKMPKDEATKIAKKALDKVGLSDRYDFYPSALSGGQQQRVGIARAIATNPEVILLDEPTSALDPELIGEVLNVIKSLADDGMTMVLVTHEMNFARKVATKIIFMDKGEVIEENSPKEFFEHPKTERSKNFVESILGSRQSE